MIENLKKYSLGGNWVRVNGALTWNPKMEENVFGEYVKFSHVEEALRSASDNKSSQKFPNYRSVEMEFDRWRHVNNERDDTVSEKNLRQFYHIIVENFGR